MGFVSSLLGFANKVGGLANNVNNSGLVGKIAQDVSKAANLVSTIVPKAMPIERNLLERLLEVGAEIGADFRPGAVDLLPLAQHYSEYVWW